MIRSQDGLLLAVTFSSIFLGVAFPNICSFFAGLPMYAMMALLFLGFLPIRLSDLMNGLKSEPIRICFFLFLKLVCLPILVYLVFINIAPEFALAALLLSGISTGVVAPFFADMLDADVPKVILVVVISSILVPFTLPLLVKILIGHQMAISLSKMIQLLGTVIFIPLMGVEILRRVKPQWIDTMLKVKQPTSLFLFAVTNMGVFSNYAFFFSKADGDRFRILRRGLHSCGTIFGCRSVSFMETTD